MRINKYLRDKGFASRREADELVKEGKVFINGEPAQIGDLVEEGDKVKVKNNKKKYKYLAYNKPRGLATQDFSDKKSVVTVWKDKGLFPVGRLDKDSEGLLILTNDGRITGELLSKKDKYEKEYAVEVKEVLNQNIINVMQKGMQTKLLGKLLPVKARIINKHTIGMILREGKKHQIRVMLDELGYKVTSLKRVRIGDIHLGKLKSGEVRKIKIDI